ncbi:MAG: putative manganese-dependent inorganic diphosphatase [Coriobacteriia bacterium]|nr:putative manganese-dependent inorganic diphosphatase [Coriobacteriia bacterium]
MGSVLVFGHRNPDNDSICSAVGYAHLKNAVDPDNTYTAARLGPAPKETEWLFGRFGLDLPEEISHVRTRVRDVMGKTVTTVTPDQTILDAGRLMRARGIRVLPVVDQGGILVGLLNQLILAERYLDETEVAGFAKTSVTVGGLARVLDAKVLSGDACSVISGGVHIGVSEPETVRGLISPGDVLIVGDRARTQPMAIKAGVACLIVTRGAKVAADVVALAQEKGAAVLVTGHDTYSVARLIALSQTVGDVMARDVLQVDPDTLLAEASKDLVNNIYREAVVTDGLGRVVGVFTRTDIARGIRRRVVLVDHNESTQSALGIEEAEVVEIVDHHRVGDIETPAPVMFLNLPLGATATIVALRFEELGVKIPPEVAGILLGAVLTDTIILKSPTTTEVDRQVCARLAENAGVDAVALGMELFRSRSAGERFSAASVVQADLKEYLMGDMRVAIVQYESVGLDRVMEQAKEIRAAMEELRESRKYDLMVLMATDIVREGSELFAVGRTRLAERAFKLDMAHGSAWMPGALSRKRQIVPSLVAAARQTAQG